MLRQLGQSHHARLLNELIGSVLLIHFYQEYLINVEIHLEMKVASSCSQDLRDFGHFSSSLIKCSRNLQLPCCQRLFARYEPECLRNWQQLLNDAASLWH